MNEKRHEKDLAEQAAMYEQRMDAMLALIDSLHGQPLRGGESNAKTAADVSLSPGEGNVGEHEKASAIAVDQRKERSLRYNLRYYLPYPCVYQMTQAK